MIDLVQWRSTIGCFNWKFKCYIGHKYANSTFENGMLHITVNDWFDVAVLHVKGMFPTALNDWFDFAVLLCLYS